jgi:hypothetical protein
VVVWVKTPLPEVVTVDTPPAPQVWVVVVPPALLLLGTQELLLDPELPPNRPEIKLPIDPQKPPPSWSFLAFA